MKNTMRGFIIGVIITSLVMLSMPVFAAPITTGMKVLMDTVRVVINGEEAHLSTIIHDGMVYIEGKGISDRLGMDYIRDRKTNRVYINDKYINITARAEATSNTTVEIAFDTAMDKTAVENIRNYQVYEKFNDHSPLTIVAASLDDTGTKLVVTTSPQRGHSLYNIDFSNMKDAAGNNVKIGSVVFPGNSGNAKPATATASSISGATVQVNFDTVLDKISAENIANYNVHELFDINKSLAVTKASLDTSGKKVTLTTSAQDASTLYKINFGSLKNSTGNSLVINSVIFTGSSSAPKATAYAIAVINTKVNIYFDTELDWAAAGNSASYKVYANDGLQTPLAVYSAVVVPNENMVTLVTASQKSPGTYYIEFYGMKDKAGNALMIDKTEFAASNVQQPKKATAVSTSDDTVEIQFDAWLDRESAENPENYIINELYGTHESLIIVSAYWDAANRKVILRTSQQKSEALYTIDFINMKNDMGEVIDIERTTFVGSPSDIFMASVASLSNTTIEITSDIPLDRASAENPANYNVYEMFGARSPLTISKAVLNAAGTKVILTTSPQKGATYYWLDIKNMRSAAGSLVLNMEITMFVGSEPGYDDVKPCRIIVTPITSTTVEVNFGIALDKNTAENIVNYNLGVSGEPLDLKISAASLDETGTKVILTTTPLNAGRLYMIGMGGVKNAEGKNLLIYPVMFIGK